MIKDLIHQIDFLLHTSLFRVLRCRDLIENRRSPSWICFSGDSRSFVRGLIHWDEIF